MLSVCEHRDLLALGNTLQLKAFGRQLRLERRATADPAKARCTPQDG